MEVVFYCALELLLRDLTVFHTIGCNRIDAMWTLVGMLARHSAGPMVLQLCATINARVDMHLHITMEYY